MNNINKNYLTINNKGTNMTKTKDKYQKNRTNLYFSAEIKEKLQKIAKEDGVSMSSVVSELIAVEYDAYDFPEFGDTNE